MKKKILFTASIAKHIIRFHLPYLKWFQEQGYETHVACNGDDETPWVDKKWTVPFIRTPFSFGHFKAYSMLKQIIDSESYDLIHCHTPMCSVITRIAARDSKQRGAKILYTAHGFHFYKGASFINWLFYYPVEKLLAKYTNAIITINTEDFELVKKKKFKCGAVYKIDGIGVNPSKFQPVTFKEMSGLRMDTGYNSDDFILIYAAEFIHRKNHKFILDSILRISSTIPSLKILFAGRGTLIEGCKKYAKKIKVDKYVDFLGFRTDIKELIAMSDIGISSSRAEGLGLNLTEGMFSGVSIVATVDRGHKEMIENGVNGFLFEQNNHEQFANQIIELYNNKSLKEKFAANALVSVQKFSIDNSLKSMAKIYQNYL